MASFFLISLVKQLNHVFYEKFTSSTNYRELFNILLFEKRTLVVNQKKKTATFHLKNITSDKEGEDANEDFKNFMTGYKTGEILNEFFSVGSNLKET